MMSQAFVRCCDSHNSCIEYHRTSFLNWPQIHVCIIAFPFQALTFAHHSILDAETQKCNTHCPGSYLECLWLHSQFPAGLLDLLGGLLLCLLCHSRMQYPAHGITHAAAERHASTMQLRIALRMSHADIIKTHAQTATPCTFLALYLRTNEYGTMRLQAS